MAKNKLFVTTCRRSFVDLTSRVIVFNIVLDEASAGCGPSSAYILRNRKDCRGCRLERVNSMKMPFAELKGVIFTEAERDRVVARMVVRPDLCTLGHVTHGGAIRTRLRILSLRWPRASKPYDAKGTTTIRLEDEFIRRTRRARTLVATATSVHRGRRTQALQTRLETEDGRGRSQSSRRRKWCWSDRGYLEIYPPRCRLNLSAYALVVAEFPTTRRSTTTEICAPCCRAPPPPSVRDRAATPHFGSYSVDRQPHQRSGGSSA